jgi:hypothetical protein
MSCHHLPGKFPRLRSGTALGYARGPIFSLMKMPLGYARGPRPAERSRGQCLRQNDVGGRAQSRPVCSSEYYHPPLGYARGPTFHASENDLGFARSARPAERSRGHRFRWNNAGGRAQSRPDFSHSKRNVEYGITRILFLGRIRFFKEMTQVFACSEFF